jgi:hypothetical protein
LNEVAVGRSSMKSETPREGLLRCGLDRLLIMDRSDPVDRFVSLRAGQNRQARKGDPGAAVGADTTRFDNLTGSRALQKGVECGSERSYLGNAKIRPVKELVRPRWIPPRIEVEAVVGNPVA